MLKHKIDDFARKQSIPKTNSKGKPRYYESTGRRTLGNVMMMIMMRMRITLMMMTLMVILILISWDTLRGNT